MDLYDLHNLINLLCDKAKIGYFTPEEKDNALHLGQTSRFSELINLYALNLAIHEALSAFKTELPFTSVDTPDGLITLPPDFVHVESVILFVMVDINQQGDQQLKTIPVPNYGADFYNWVRSSPLMNPTVERPAGMLKGNYFQLFPEAPAAGKLYYFRKPAKPHLAYSLAGRVFTYDQPGSTQLEFPDNEALQHILPRACEILGINIQDANLFQMSAVKDKEVRP